MRGGWAMSSERDRTDRSGTPSTNEPDREKETNGSAGVDETAQPPQPNVLPRPKRGAFPTPQSEIDKAKPYTPEDDETD
jgi:hypothetical protein